MADTRYEIRDTREVERRAWPVERLEVRAAEGEATAIVGYAAVFDQLSVDLGGWYERIAPGAFERSLLDNDVRALWDHNSLYVLGRNRAGTLELKEDVRGLGVEIRPPDAGWARDLITSMKRGDVNQMSFGFYTRRDEWIEEDGLVVRVLLDVDLFDVSVVTYPAYPQTSAEARKRGEEEIGRLGDWEIKKERPGTAGDDEAGKARARSLAAARQREIEILNEVL